MPYLLLRTLAAPCCLALVLALAPGRCEAISIAAELTSLGGNVYRAVYSVHNDGSLGAGASVLLFDVLFDPADYDESSLAIATQAPLAAAWDELLLASAPGVPAAYDALALATGIGDGETASGFAVEFSWLGAGAPGSQPFAVYDAETFELLESGVTVPEPGVLALLVAFTFGLYAPSRRARCAVALVGAALCAPGAASAMVVGAEDIVIGSYALLSSERVSRTEFEYTYAADVQNWQEQALEISGSLATTSPHITVVEGSVAFGAVPAGGTQQGLDTFTIRVDRQFPFDPDALIWTVATSPVPPTSYTLIDAALEAGTIDDETALAYKVFADFRDPRLPADLRGADDDVREGQGAETALERFASLSVATQDLLAPFLVRPEDPASWLRAPAATFVPAAAVASPASRKSKKKEKRARRAATSFTGALVPAVDPLPDVLGTLATRNGKVWVHWRKDEHPDDDGVAQVLADAIDDAIWPKLTDLLGEPKPDDDGILDVYLIDTPDLTILLSEDAGNTNGVTRIRVGACGNGNQAAVVYLNRDKLADLEASAAHEIAHAIQARFTFSSGCGETRWLREAHATWSEHFVYPSKNSEHGYAPSFLDRPEVPLEDRSHEYGAYLWFLYATRNADANAPAEVRSVLDFLALHDSLGALDAVAHITTGKSLRERFAEFALYNWNRVVTKKIIILGSPPMSRYSGEPYVYYGSWDGVGPQARESTGTEPLRVDLGGTVSKTYKLNHRIRHLAAKYFHYDFRGDSSVRRLRFEHPYAGGFDPSVKVQALVKLRGRGGWKKVEDWTGDEKHFLCRDKPDEDFEELAIVISNGEFSDKSHVIEDLDGEKTQLTVSALGCRERYVGSSQFHMHRSSGSLDVTETAMAEDVTLSIVKPFKDGDDGLQFQTYNATGGTVSYTHTGQNGDCHGESSGTFSAASNLFATLTLGQGGEPTYLLLGFQEDAPEPNDYTCSDGSTFPAPIADYPVWVANRNPFGSGELPRLDDTNDGTLMGSTIVSNQGSSKSTDWSWFFSPQGTFDD